MKLIIDANRLFSALLKDGPTRKAIFETDAILFAPEFRSHDLDFDKQTLVPRVPHPGAKLR